MKSIKQNGFTAVEGLMVILVIVVLSAAGYFVWHQDHRAAAPTALSSLSNSGTKKSITSVSSLTKTYTSPQYGFSFKYPASWKLTTDLKDLGRGGPEGDIYVQAPDGTKVHFGPDFGGKGGDCIDDQANGQHTTRTCTTRKIYSVTKLANSGSEPVWLLHASDTAPIDAGGKTTYFVYLASAYGDGNGNATVAPKVGSSLGAFLGTYDDVGTSKANLTVYVDGPDDSKNNSSAFFMTQEVKEATPVLESLKV